LPKSKPKKDISKKSNSTKLPKAQNVDQPSSFPIVGIGASAGGLEAAGDLLAHLPIDTGLAFILIQHLDPTHESLSAEILSRKTKIPVAEVKDDTNIKSNFIYVMPPNRDLAIINGRLKLCPRSEGLGHMPIDLFFKSLAEDQGSNAIGVILSGTASDGTLGLESIKAEGGLTIAQEPSSAEYDGMPRSAISSGVVDLVQTPMGIAKELKRISKHAYTSLSNTTLEHQRWNEHDESLNKIFSILKTETHIDFSHYKSNTIQRRISRRLLVLDIQNLESYSKFLETHPAEVKALFADILIHVTSFFREPKTFEAFKNQILPQYIKNRDPKLPFRIWVAGCSTGEEAYSIAITFLEFRETSGLRINLNIFASDISEFVLQKARKGFYPKSIKNEISKERLQKFFEKTDDGYKITKRVRDICIFSRHDLIKDPPFAKLDMIICRNLLIYFSAPLQKHVFPIFHYALNPSGILWLGSAESVGEFSNLFSHESKTGKFYFKKNIKLPSKFKIPISRFPVDAPGTRPRSTEITRSTLDAEQELDKVASSQYVPPGVLINDNMDILHARGRTDPYLALAPGQPNFNLLKMVHPELIAELRSIIIEARKKGTSVKREHLSLQEKKRTLFFNVNVVPISLQTSKEHYFSIFFEEIRQPKKQSATPVLKTNQQNKKNQDFMEMERKVSASHEYQQTLIEQFATAQEELTTSNEELQSTNEELQSTNEELETAKEELQSINEELSTVNEELNIRNEQLKKAHDDSATILKKIPIPLITVDSNKKVITANEPFYEKFQVAASETEGRLFSELGDGNWNIPVLLHMVESVLYQGTEFKNYEVEYAFPRIGYKTMILNAKKVRLPGSGTDAALIAIEDFTERKRTEQKLKFAEDRYRRLLTSAHEGILIVDSRSTIDFVNNKVEELFGYNKGELLGKSIDILIPDTLKKKHVEYHSQYMSQPKLREMGSGINLYGKRKDGSKFPVDISLNPVKSGNETFVTAIIRDSSVRLKQEQETARVLEVETKAREASEKANRSKDEFVATLSHELRTPLSSILSWAQLIQSGKLDAEKTKRGITTIEQSAKAQSQLIDDLLDISRIQTGKLNLAIQKVDPSKVIDAAIDSTRSLAASKSIQIETNIDPMALSLDADPTRLQQIFWNLITNAIKFSPQGGKIWIGVKHTEQHSIRNIQIQVRDNGKGIKKELIPIIFERFTQIDSSSTRAYGGLGLGLAIVRKLVEMHEGFIEVESPGIGKGSTFTIVLPEKSKVKYAAPEDEIVADLEITLTGSKVLLVDDEPNAREVFGVMIQSFGAEVRTASSVNEALSVLDKFNPDILISDIAMPGEDGYNLISKVRAMKSNLAQIPALALTAYATEEDIQRIHLAGFQSHVGKPVDRCKLALAIARLVERR